MLSRLLVVAACCALSSAVAGCGSETNAAAEEVHESPKVGQVARMTREAYGKSRQVFADSVLKAAKPASEVVKDLGDEFVEASPRLVDSLTTASNLTDCFETGRKVDPYLAGTVSYSVDLGEMGSTLVQIQQSQWTSTAGNIVHACLQLAARAWKFGPEFGTAGRQVAQVKFGASR
jgi:hypothetical protein